MFLDGYTENFGKFVFKKQQVNILIFGAQISTQCQALGYCALMLSRF
jgi:hypothetical protein